MEKPTSSPEFGLNSFAQANPATRAITSVLSSPGFRFLWLAQFLSQLADKFLMYALLVLISATSHIASAASLLMLAYTFPSILLSTAAGVYADRVDKRLLMLLTNLIRAGVILLIPLLAWLTVGFGGATWLLLIPITLVFSSVGQFFAPAEAASIPVLVPPQRLSTATSYFTVTVFLTLLLGVPLAALAISQNQQIPFYLGTLLFILAAFSLTRIRPSLHSVPISPVLHTSWLSELKDGLSMLRRSPPLRIAMLVLALTLGVIFTMFVLGPGYMTSVLHHPGSQTYLILAPSMFGLILTAALVSRVPLPLSSAQLLALALLTLGIANLGFSLVPLILNHFGLVGLLFPCAVIFAFLFGAALGFLIIPAFTVLQQQTTLANRGRIFGNIFAVINASIAVPLLLAGALADLFHSDLVPLGGLGFLLALTGLIYLGPLRSHLTPFNAHPASIPL